MKSDSGISVQETQRLHWEATYANSPEMFGLEPSEAARKAADIFREEKVTTILELGAGQGRDTLFFAQNNFRIHALDYSAVGVAAIMGKAQSAGIAHLVSTQRHDVRHSLPFEDASLDACYAHMLFCMAFTVVELEFLASEIRRALKPGGLCIYTARNNFDPHYGKGIHHSGHMYETNGFMVHFFTGETIDRLAKGYDLIDVIEFEEGTLPRKLFFVMKRKS